MTPSEIAKDIITWQTELGINKTPEYQIDPDELAAIIESGVDGISIQELEKLILKISSYNLFLKREKGLLTSRLIYLQDQLDRTLYLETQKLGEDYKYRKFEEKVALIKETNSTIQTLADRVVLAEIKVNQIKDIPGAIDAKLEILKIIYERKLNE